MANKKKFYLMGKSKFLRFGSLTLTRAVYSGEVAKILHKKKWKLRKNDWIKDMVPFFFRGSRGDKFWDYMSLFEKAYLSIFPFLKICLSLENIYICRFWLTEKMWKFSKKFLYFFAKVIVLWKPYIWQTYKHTPKQVKFMFIRRF